MMQHSLLEESAKLRHDARETSRLAALTAAPPSAGVRKQVLDFIAARGEHGATDDEISHEMLLSPNTARPRRVELVEGGWIMDSQERRPSFYGNPSIVWRVTPDYLERIK